MRHLLALLAGLLLLSAACAKAPASFACDFQDDPPYTCTTPDGSTDLTIHGTTLGTCGMPGIVWQAAHVAKGGWHDRAYLEQTYCAEREGAGSASDQTGYVFRSPPGLDWSKVAEFHLAFRVYLDGPITLTSTSSNPIRTLKWIMAHQSVYGGDQRMISYFERGDLLSAQGCTADRHVVFAAARNIFSGSGPGNLGTDVARWCLPIKQWQSIQVAWTHGPLDTSALRLYVNTNDPDRPTAIDTHLDPCSTDSCPEFPGGTNTWARDDAGYAIWNLAAHAGTNTQFEERFTIRLMDLSVSDTFNRSFAAQ